MKNVSSVIAEIAAIGSTLAKQAIVEKNANDKALEMAFFYAENPRFNYWIKAEPTMVGRGKREISIDTFQALNQLIHREVTGNAARAFLHDIVAEYTPEEAEIICRIVNKDLRCNCGTSIANKVWKDLIPEYPVMLASKFDAKAVKYLTALEGNEQFIVQRKCDGGRCIVKVDGEGNVSYHSRNGSTLELFGRFDDQFKKELNKVFDGELLVTNEKGVADRKTGNGFYTRAVRGTLTKEQAASFSIVIWDVIEEEHFNKGFFDVPYSNRLQFLTSAEFKNGVSVVESKFVRTLVECQEFYAIMRARGEEGAIIKVASSPWEDKRSKNMVKLKAIIELDAIVIGWEEGSGKYKGMLGALVCQSNDIYFNVGSGFTDDERKKLTKENTLGYVVEVNYNEIISDKRTGKKSLFLPIFVRMRYDKNSV